MDFRFFILPLLMMVLTGCSSVQIERGVSTSIRGLDSVPAKSTGKTTVEIKARSPILLDEFFAGRNGVFFLQKNTTAMNVDNYRLFNITTDKEVDSTFCYVGGTYGKSSLEACKNELIRDNSLIQAKRMGNNLYVGASDDTYVFFSPRFDRSSGFLTVEFIDYSDAMMAWKNRYQDVKGGGINEYLHYAKEFPETYHTKAVMKDMFNKFFSVKIIDKKESAVRSTRGRGLVTSEAGACKDITRKIEIKSTASQVPSRDIFLDVKYILKRTYSPHALSEKDDPLYLNKTYTLGRGNSFKLVDDITFDCVATSIRVHTVVLSLVGKVLGQNEKSMGIKTDLTKFGFDIDIMDVK